MCSRNLPLPPAVRQRPFISDSLDSNPTTGLLEVRRVALVIGIRLLAAIYQIMFGSQR